MLYRVFARHDQLLKNIESATSAKERWFLFAIAWISSVENFEGDVVEIGTAWGRSALTMALPVMLAKGDQVICIDTWEPYQTMTGTKFHIPYSAFLKNATAWNLLESVHPMKGSSKELWGIWGKECRIRFLFIDGCHQYQTVYSDILSYGSRVEFRSVIACHDYNFFPETTKAIDEAAEKMNKGIEVVDHLALLHRSNDWSTFFSSLTHVWNEHH
jgi:hypothetical protein